MRANDILEKRAGPLNEDSSEISSGALLSFIKNVAAALESRDIESLESMKNEMDDTFDDDGNSLVQTKLYLINNAVEIIGDWRVAERRGG